MYCSYPYRSLHINPNGKIRPCCRFNGYLENDQDGFNLREIFYGNNMQCLRDLFDKTDKSVFVDTCFRCYNEEAKNVLSLREKHLCEIEETKLEMIELLFSNVCNFKCRTCNSCLSTRWKDDDKVLIRNGFNDRYVFEFNELTNINYDGIDTLEHFKITGGEPFLYNDLENNLLEVIERNPNCRLSIYTNGSIFPNDSIIQTMKRFKSVNIGISVDGYKSVNDYIRFGSNWKQVEDNIFRFKDCNFETRLVTVISAYSLPRMKELLEWWGKGNHIFIYLQKPSYININVLPKGVLNQAANDLSQYQHLPFISLIKNCKSVDDTEFQKYTKILDELRGQDYDSIK